ncbi:hypothetical protein PsorP6_013431 [Peronosclerospora sorghi]|uniref:Uncharacterized protein n=1 Tax=Peronosclerospora sorghi TaxID=230839 RepID=A0ACC0VF77_9STRA|nr:hypothetical protein PsorP6_013431 [Peronosclerospora sorghi]
MAGKQVPSDGTLRPRVDASNDRLASLRTPSDPSTTAARRPKFVPKATKRRSAVEGREEGDSSRLQHSHDAKPLTTGAGALKYDNRGRGEFGRRGGRGGRGGGRGRGRGRGRGVLPSGKVAFVGTLSDGSSYSASAPRVTPTADYSAAGGTGISVLDEKEMPGSKILAVEEQTVWPPPVKSVMEPMSLPVVRPPEPENAGSVFCDATGDLLAADDSLFFIQMPTTLPLPRAMKTANTDEDESMDKAHDMKDEEAKVSESKSFVDSIDNGVFDHSFQAAPGGFIGKICVHKSGKMMFMLGDKQFEVAAAQTPSFCEELYAVNTTEKRLSLLGHVERHLVVTPDFDVLLH